MIIFLHGAVSRSFTCVEGLTAKVMVIRHNNQQQMQTHMHTTHLQNHTYISTLILLFVNWIKPHYISILYRVSLLRDFSWMPVFICVMTGEWSLLQEGTELSLSGLVVFSVTVLCDAWLWFLYNWRLEHQLCKTWEYLL